MCHQLDGHNPLMTSSTTSMARKWVAAAGAAAATALLVALPAPAAADPLDDLINYALTERYGTLDGPLCLPFQASYREWQGWCTWWRRSIALDRLAEMTDLYGPRLSGSQALEDVRLDADFPCLGWYYALTYVSVSPYFCAASVLAVDRLDHGPAGPRQRVQLLHGASDGAWPHALHTRASLPVLTFVGNTFHYVHRCRTGSAAMSTRP